MSFINPERGGDGAGDYPIYLQPVRGNWRGGQRVLLRRLGCYGGHRGLHSKGISVHIVVGWMEAHLLLAVSGFSAVEVV